VGEANSGRTTSMLTQGEGVGNAPRLITSPTDSNWWANNRNFIKLIHAVLHKALKYTNLIIYYEN
jgi:hypothetical protein